MRNINRIQKLYLKRLPLTSGLAAGGVLARGTLYRYFESSVPIPSFANPRLREAAGRYLPPVQRTTKIDCGSTKKINLTNSCSLMKNSYFCI